MSAWSPHNKLTSFTSHWIAFLGGEFSALSSPLASIVVSLLLSRAQLIRCCCCFFFVLLLRVGVSFCRHDMTRTVGHMIGVLIIRLLRRPEIRKDYYSHIIWICASINIISNETFNFLLFLNNPTSTRFYTLSDCSVLRTSTEEQFKLLFCIHLKAIDHGRSCAAAAAAVPLIATNHQQMKRYVVPYNTPRLTVSYVFVIS